jgi:hypothetical protein
MRRAVRVMTMFNDTVFFTVLFSLTMNIPFEGDYGGI